MKLLHLYHDIMNLYGEYANVLALRDILRKGGVDVEVEKKSFGEKVNFADYDFVYVGSGTERNQKLVLEDFRRLEQDFRDYVGSGKPALWTGNSFEILGSAITEIWAAEGDHVSKIVFSGDLGMKDKPILRDPVTIKKADYVIMETTYGDRLHPAEGTSGIEQLLDIIVKTVKRKGTVVIPSFAVGRTQELIFELNRYYEDTSNPYRDVLENLDVYIDSPMATTATEVFKNNAQVFDEETKDYILKGDNPLDFKNLKFTRTTDDSRALNFDTNPKIIISASGMCEAGRIRHHLKHNLWNPKNSIVFVGYQAEGTLGRMLVDGVKDVTLFGEQIHVNAEIHFLEGFSGHADRDGLFEWLAGFRDKQPSQVFLVHGEPAAKEAFADYVEEHLGYRPVVVPGVSEFELETANVLSRTDAPRDIIDIEAVENIRKRIADVHTELESVLYQSNQLLDGDKASP